MPQKKLQICHVITRMIVGGAQENTLLTVRGLLDKGHRVVLLTGPTDGPEGALLEKQPLPGLELRVEPLLTREISPWRDWRAVRSLRHYFAGEKFDVVHTHSSKAGVIGRLAANQAGVPAILHTVHGQAFHQYEKWWRNFIYITAERRAARNCHRILAVCQAMIDQCVQAGVAPAEMYRVVYSGMDMAAFAGAGPEPKLRAELGIPPAAPVVGKVARLFELKGHDLLLLAAEMILKQQPETRFLLVGDGNLRTELTAEIKARGMEKNFVFTGLVAPDAVPAYVAQMDVLVHLSLREGLPRAAVQALAAGKPVVGLNLDGTPEVVLDGQTGYVCEPGDTAAVAAAVIRLLEQPELRRKLGEAGQALVLREFDWRLMAERIEEQYYEVLEVKN